MTVRYDISQNGTKCMPMDYEAYFVDEKLPYVPRGYEMDLLRAHLEGKDMPPIILFGPKGTAKTMLVRYYAEQNKLPYLCHDCHNQTDAGDLFGKFIIHERETPYIFGSLARAIKLANHHGKAVIVLEEINALNQESQKMLNAFLDWRKEAYLAEIGETAKLDSEAKLLVVGTMNVNLGASTYGGIFELNEDFKSRFAMKKIDYPPLEHETHMLQQLTRMDDSVISRVISIAASTRKNQELTFQLSPRELVQFGKVWPAYLTVLRDKDLALYEALCTTFLDKYTNTKDRNWVKEQIRSVLNIKIE